MGIVNWADEIERRAVRTRELRASADGEPPRLTGYAAVFNSLSEDLGGFREQIKSGAFSKTLTESDVRALWNHDPNIVLGRTRSGTLRLREDNIGLAFEIDLPDTQQARDLIVLARRGDVDQMSFGFRTIKDGWDTVGEQIVRTLVEVQLFDVSPVTFPAYPQTSANVRSKLSELQPSTAQPGQAAHSADDAQGQARARLDLQRRRLDLADLIDIVSRRDQ